jgi:hypothetical protein
MPLSYITCLAKCVHKKLDSLGTVPFQLHPISIVVTVVWYFQSGKKNSQFPFRVVSDFRCGKWVISHFAVINYLSDFQFGLFRILFGAALQKFRIQKWSKLFAICQILISSSVNWTGDLPTVVVSRLIGQHKVAASFQYDIWRSGHCFMYVYQSDSQSSQRSIDCLTTCFSHAN